MEPAKAPFAPPPREGPSKEELEKLLEGHKADDLKEMARRLAKSHENMNEMLEDLQVEKKSLEEENAELQQTIDRFMKELQKLNIGADNTVEPQLDEGPQIFLNRMWEKVRPRDTAVVVSEHVGDIKKPVLDEEDGENSPQGAEKVRQVVDNVANTIAERAGPLWERGLGAWSNLQSNLQQRLNQPAPKKEGPKKRKPKAEARPDVEAAPVPAAVVEAAPTAEKPAEVDMEQVAASTAASSTATPAKAEEPAPAAAPAAAPAKEAEAAAEEATKGAMEEQISSTILIEAELTLEDGSKEFLQVRAADRCKEVANRFIQEHSLKAWYGDPLTKWLKKVEADAVKFPVKISGDLTEIRKQYSRGA
jgi:hypothetical protein